MLVEIILEEETNMLTCNLSKIVHNIWFQQSGNKGFVSLLQRSMITCKHSCSLHCIMPFYKEVHLGPARTKMDCACIRPVSMGTQFKLLL